VGHLPAWLEAAGPVVPATPAGVLELIWATL
jgi:hypothetical protein